ncbi:choice-of-anchor L domain-containing protein [Fluviicola taffensis]|uniref:PKD domain containing protein n=1 Tax=Fluviicola taffensis (strain DSM 16823 / NCIMB 13979 / RW262) TaxID=755732 RepID=F2IIF2_FLUTR|nr:choice-of-anchor L domain-containing protein [Fluviicola taffensis]AEA44878.1 PKD domain containing protein [Fluviicola taffensis DSM 16823]
MKRATTFRLSCNSLLLLLFMTSFSKTTFAQITLSQTTAANYVANICGPGITFSNVTLTGDAGAIAQFLGGNSGGLGASMNSGVVMSTGYVNAANALQGANGAQVSSDNNGGAIAALNTIAGAATNDGIILEFDFVPITGNINVNYVFGSEEYNEYVNSGYNDAFAFFISGPGIVGTPNIAVIGAVPVTIDNINNGTNAGSYRNNQVLNNNNIMDGYTVQLTASRAVIACETYHIQLMIADGGDQVYDSWVFIQENGLFAVGNPPVSSVTSSGAGPGIFPEGCSNNTMTFNIPTALATPYSFNVTWTGTSTSGADYSALPTTITIPAGQTSVTIPVNVILDGIAEGSETLICTYPATVCAAGVAIVNIVDANPLTVTASPDVNICTTGSSVPLSATSTGGTGTVTYTWSPGGATGTPVNVSPTATTTYTVTATDQCANIVTDQVIVTYSALTTPTVTPTAESCANYNNGSVVINNPVGFGPYTVSISGPTTGSVVEANTAAATANFTNLPDGNYNYIVTGANGCTLSGTFSIAVGPPCCSVTAVNTNILCNGSPTGTATATPVGLAPYTYSWTGGGQTSQTATGLAAGPYTVTMTDNSGCVATANVTVTQPTVLSGTIAAVNVSCNAACNGTITVTAAGGTPGYQYSLNGGAFQASNAFTGLCNGTYAVTIRDANNCTVIINQNITQPAVLNLTQASISPANCGGTGSVTVTPSGGTAPYTYTIDGGASQASPTFSGLAPGTDTVVVTDNRGCTRNLIITIVATSAPVASILNQTNVSCFGGVNGSVIIGLAGGSSPFTYSIGGPFQASNTFTNITAGTYTATVTDANSCSGTVSFTITTPPQLTFTSTATAASCNGVCDGQIQVNATGGTAPYQYSSNNGITYVLANPLTGLCAGTTSVVVKDANGCLTNSDIIITQPAPVSGTFVNTNPICNGVCDGTITVTPSGGTPTYQYSLNGGALQAGNTITGGCGGNNTIMIQDSHGCQFTSVQVLIDPPGFGIDTTVVIESNCGFNNGSINVVANGTNGPFSYTMTGAPAQPQPTGVYTNLFAGAYEITAVDQLGCSESVFFGINDVEMDGITLFQTDANCFGVADGTIEVQNVSGAIPITYELDNNPPTQSSGFFPNIPFGSHIVTIYDGGFCVFTIPFNVAEPTEIQFDTDLTNISCNAGSTGEIEFINVSGGTGAHQFSIDGGTTYQSSPIFTGLPAGTYPLDVMDANGCTVSGSVTLIQAPALTIASTVFDLTCFGDASGGIQIGSTGGTGAYQYSILGGAVGSFSPIESFFGLSAGTYNLVTQDAAGCQITGTAIVNQPAQLTATYTATNATCFGVCDGEIAVNASGGTTPYLYSPDNGLNYFVATTLENLCAGNIDIQVKDDNDCFITAVQVITQPTIVTVNAVPTDATCSLANGQIALTGAGGTGAYTYSIGNPTAGPYTATSTYTGLLANVYNVFVHDANNCEATTTVSIANFASPIIIGSAVTNVSCNAACDGELQVTVSGGTGTISYSIGTPQAAPLITGICAGNYTLTITDQNGCTDTEPIVVTEPAVLTATVTPTALTCFNNNTGEITFVASGGTIPYSYSTNNGVSFFNQTNVQFLSAGTYNTVVRDANGCLVNTAVIVTEPALLTIQNITTNNASCHGVCDGDATATITGGTIPYSFAWSDGTTGTSANGLCAATYDVTVTDDNGCSAIEIFNITEPPLLVITSTSATDALCNGDCNGTATINSPLATAFSIDNGATFQPSNVFNGLCAGTYQIQVQDAAGCTQNGAVTLGEPQVLVQGLIPEDGLLICYNGNGTISANATGGTAPYYFVWNTGDTTQFLNVNLTSPATFNCTVIDQNGCASNVQSATVNIRPLFTASVTTPLNVCPGDSVTFTASGTGGLPGIGYPYFYQWLSNPSLALIEVGETYTFVPAHNDTVVLVGRDECNTYDTLIAIVNVYTLPNALFTVDPAVGCAPLQATFTFPSTATGIASVTWDFGDGSTGTGTPGISHDYTEVGCYDVSVEITTVDGCIVDTTMQNFVCVVPDPIANFNWSPIPPSTINSTVHFTDNSVNAVTYDWDFGTFGTSTLENPIVNYGDIEAGSYQVCLTVTSPEGCQDSICKPIVFIEEFLVYVPNTFTPDGDEFNNVFRPIVPDGMDLDDYTFTIFNRWGEVLFESHDVNFGWDGTYNGTQVKEGTYIWTIVARGATDKKARKFEGHVNMLK